MSKSIIFKSFYCLTKLAYSIAIPSALSSAFLTCIFRLKLTIGPERNNPEEAQNDEEQNGQEESVLVFYISIPSLLH